MKEITACMTAALLVVLGATARIEAQSTPGVDLPTMGAEHLAPKRMLEFARLPREQFVRAWNAQRKAALAELNSHSSKFTATQMEERRVRLAFLYAQGRVMYPFFHWRETDAAEIEPDPGLPAVLAALPELNAARLKLPEASEFAEARVHELARTHLARDPDLGQGDARWLRAELRALEEVIPDRTIWMGAAEKTILRHIDEDGSAGVDAAIGRWLALAPAADSVQRVRSAMAADLGHQTGYRRVKYREVGGVPLHLYLRASSSDTSPRAAFLWLHGGSATEGTWWHAALTPGALEKRGVSTIFVELTTGNRFDRDSDQTSDASAAFEFVRQNAQQLGVDPKRIGVAGFSSGASVALLLATRGAAPAAMGSGKSAEFPRPAAIIVSGACANPLAASEDGYFRKVMSKIGDPADFSPLAQLRSGLPPILAVHATNDEYCSFDEMQGFANRSRSLGNEVVVVPVADAGHFFPFYHPEGQRQHRAAVNEALDRWGW